MRNDEGATVPREGSHKKRIGELIRTSSGRICRGSTTIPAPHFSLIISHLSC